MWLIDSEDKVYPKRTMELENGPNTLFGISWNKINPYMIATGSHGARKEGHVIMWDLSKGLMSAKLQTRGENTLSVAWSPKSNALL